MINVDFASPSLVLGITLIGCGIALLQVRNVQREVSRDADIVVAAMISIVGSTLIFQGWRLDPLLLLCQALTTSVAFWYGLETFKLRGQIAEEVSGASADSRLCGLMHAMCCSSRAQPAS
ncbi:Ycf66 protein N-terminus-domain-containing protein [Scenedesmus sp. NREL 46B-D3]|nr:Ycf66 protein N-terminus-domain-containing protein [Scenedesmus sp. NREL 46B-D3]